MPGTLAIFGEGHAAQTLSGASWLGEVAVYYWGDLDPTGLDILNRLRRRYPKLSSVLMDDRTLEENADLLSEAARIPRIDHSLLTESERRAAERVQMHGAGIEQEKIPPAYVRVVLIQALDQGAGPARQ